MNQLIFEIVERIQYTHKKNPRPKTGQMSIQIMEMWSILLGEKVILMSDRKY